MELPPVELVCYRCNGTGKITNPDAHDIHCYVEWLYGIHEAMKKEREIWNPIQVLTKFATVNEGYDWMLPEEDERWLWATTNKYEDNHRYYVG